MTNIGYSIEMINQREISQLQHSKHRNIKWLLIEEEKKNNNVNCKWWMNSHIGSRVE